VVLEIRVLRDVDLVEQNGSLCSELNRLRPGRLSELDHPPDCPHGTGRHAAQGPIEAAAFSENRARVSAESEATIRPNPRNRENMLVLWLVHNGFTRIWA